MPMNPRLLRPLAPSGDSDVRAYIAAVEAADTQPLEQAVKDAYRDFIVGCKADGIWDAIKASCILAGARTLAGALVPLKGAAPTNNGPFVSGDYDRETGLVGNGTSKYLDSNRAANADPQDNFHVAVYSQGEPKTNAIYIGSGQFGVSGTTQLVSPSGAGLTARARSRAGGIDSLGTPDTGGLFGMSRASSASYSFRVSGVGGTVSRVSETPVADDYFVFATNGAAIAPVDNRLAFYSIGESLDLALLDTRVSALITAIGAAI
jgi:hypothetical protein